MINLYTGVKSREKGLKPDTSSAPQPPRQDKLGLPDPPLGGKWMPRNPLHRPTLGPGHSWQGHGLQLQCICSTLGPLPSSSEVPEP